MEEYSIKITVDTNDADYVTNVSTINQKTLDKIRPLIEAIKKKTQETKGWFHNFERSEYSDEFNVETIYPEFSAEVFEELDWLCPSIEGGFHSIESIEIGPKITWTKLL